MRSRALGEPDLGIKFQVLPNWGMALDKTVDILSLHFFIYNLGSMEAES